MKDWVEANENLVATARGLLLDKNNRLYFAGQDFTINLIPQALFLLGMLGSKLCLKKIRVILK